MKIKGFYIPIIVFSLLALGIFMGKFLDFPIPKASFSKLNHKNKINKLIDFIDNEYVDAINTDSIVDLTVDNILGKLDPHSVYIPSNEQALESQNMKGDFVGIGINFYQYKDTLAIVKPINNGPAEKAGLKAGDRILYAGNYKLFGRKIPQDTLFSKLKGKEDTNVMLTIYRKSNRSVFKVNLKRAVVPIESVDAALLLNPTTGYIKINRFAETTYNEFKLGLDKLIKQGAKSLVIDLRDNGGGYIEAASKIADELLEDKKLIVFTKNKKNQIDKFYATNKGSFEKGNLFILINENSASASEILAGAIQDNDRGTIVGRRSFGKGLVQREMDFDDGSAVRLTIARYYTPTGRSIQKPYKKGKEEYYKEFEKRFANGELYDKDSIKVNDSLKFKTSRGKLVYGGGGIVPDVFVPLDKNLDEEGLIFVTQSGLLGHFVFEQLDKNRVEFHRITLSQLLSLMAHKENYFVDFQKYLSKNGIELELTQNKKTIKHYLTAEFTKQLFSDEEYYQILLKEDSMIKTLVYQNKI